MKKLLVIAAVAALACLSFGQGRGRFMMMGGGGGRLMLALRDDVAKELNLTADQKTKLQDAQDKQRDDMQQMFQSMRGNGNDGPPDQAQQDAMRKAFEDMQAKEKATVEGILTADQIKRLNELRLQRQGNSAILDPEMQKTLNMTDDQKKKVGDLVQKQMDAMQELRQKAEEDQISREEMRDARQKNQKIMEDELGKILTDTQRKQLADMCGKPFTFDTSLDNQRFGGGGQ